MDSEIKKFLKSCNIVINNENMLERQLIPRDIMLSEKTYESVKEKIPELKKKLSSSSLTSLHKNAKQEQKWPLLNLVRQILKTYNYTMKPTRKAAGYTKDGKKKYKRFFIIDKLKTINPATNTQ